MLYGVLDVCVVTIGGEYGACGLWSEDEEFSLYVSEFKYTVYCGRVWIESVELGVELTLYENDEYRSWKIFTNTNHFYRAFFFLQLTHYRLFFSRIYRKIKTFLFVFFWIFFFKKEAVNLSGSWAEIISVMDFSFWVYKIVLVMKF